MSTKMTAAQQELYNQTIKELDIIVLANPTINLLKTDTLFQGVVSECVGIVNYFETKYDIANGSTNRYMQAYFTICNKQLTFNDDPKLYKNVTDLKDKVNYLNTYLINKIGKSFEDLEHSFKANNTNIQTNNNNNQQTEQTSPEQENYSNHNAHPISDEEVLRQNGYTMRDVADQLINTQASILLQRNIAKGKVFIYTSKPKIIPVIKIITFILFIALMVMTIASYVVLMLDGARKLYYYPLSSSGTTSTDPVLISFTNVFPYIPIIVCLFIGFIAFSVIRNMKNDNAKFFMPWGWLSFFVFFILVITMTSNESQILLFNRLGSFDSIFRKGLNIDESTNNWTATALEAIRLINIWKVFQYITYGLLGCVVICIVSAAIFNPKRDVERIQQLLQQYATEIRNGEIDTTNLGGNGLGGLGSRIF